MSFNFFNVLSVSKPYEYPFQVPGYVSVDEFAGTPRYLRNLERTIHSEHYEKPDTQRPYDRRLIGPFSQSDTESYKAFDTRIGRMTEAEIQRQRAGAGGETIDVLTAKQRDTFNKIAGRRAALLEELKDKKNAYNLLQSANGSEWQLAAARIDYIEAMASKVGFVDGDDMIGSVIDLQSALRRIPTDRLSEAEVDQRDRGLSFTERDAELLAEDRRAVNNYEASANTFFLTAFVPQTIKGDVARFENATRIARNLQAQVASKEDRLTALTNATRLFSVLPNTATIDRAKEIRYEAPTAYWEQNFSTEDNMPDLIQSVINANRNGKQLAQLERALEVEMKGDVVPPEVVQLVQNESGDDKELAVGMYLFRQVQDIDEPVRKLENFVRGMDQLNIEKITNGEFDSELARQTFARTASEKLEELRKEYDEAEQAIMNQIRTALAGSSASYQISNFKQALSVVQKFLRISEGNLRNAPFTERGKKWQKVILAQERHDNSSTGVYKYENEIEKILSQQRRSDNVPVANVFVEDDVSEATASHSYSTRSRGTLVEDESRGKRRKMAGSTVVKVKLRK